MTVLLPEQLPTSSSWGVTDYRDVRGQAVADGTGVASVELEQLSSDELWLVDHMVASCDSATPTEMRLYASTADPRALLDGTSRGNFDVADWPAGLRVSGDALLAVWTGATPGATATLTLQVRVLRRR